MEGKKFDSAVIEKNLDLQYDDLFLNRLKDRIKEIKAETHRCALSCIGIDGVDSRCVEICDEKHKKFFRVVEDNFKKGLEKFEGCKEKCFDGKNVRDCQFACIGSLNVWFDSKRLFDGILNDLSRG
jgi:hypothetical protein